MQRRGFFKALAAGIAALAGVKAVAGPLPRLEWLPTISYQSILDDECLQYYEGPPKVLRVLPTPENEAFITIEDENGTLHFFEGTQWSPADRAAMPRREPAVLNLLRPAVRW